MVDTSTAPDRAPGAVPPGASAERSLAGSATALRRVDIPQDVVAAAVDCILDTLAVGLAGGSEDVVRHVGATVDEAGPCSTFAVGKAGGRAAALVNGTAAHALDFDDWLPAGGLHPSAPLFPAVLAQADLLADSDGDVGGARFLTAFVAGFEAQARIGAALSPGHYTAGFHPTATIGVFGAAVGVAHLLGLDAERTGTALSLAATRSAGLRAMFGSMAKPLHAGSAAEGGLLAARLAGAGLTAGPDGVFGRFGFAESHGHAVDLAPLQDLGVDDWYLRDVLIKKHASCFGTHAAIDGILQLRAGLEPADVVEIELTVPELLRTVCAIPEPGTPLEGKFSLAFTSALALAMGRCATTEFVIERVHDPALRSLTRRVRLRWDATMAPQQTRVRMCLADGRERVLEVDSAVVPTPTERRAAVVAKFRSLVRPVLGDTRADELRRAVMALAGGAGLRAVTEVIAAGS